MPRQKIERLALPRITKRQYPSHGDVVEEGALVGQTDTDYFYWLCPTCQQILQTEPLSFDLIDGKDYVLRIGLYCQACGLKDLVKIGSTGWKGGMFRPRWLAYEVKRVRTDQAEIPLAEPQHVTPTISKRISLPPKKRFTVMLQHGFRCYYCSRNPVEHGVVLVIDHMQPKASGGANQDDNYVPACEECNRGKGKMDIVGI